MVGTAAIVSLVVLDGLGRPVGLRVAEAKGNGGATVVTSAGILREEGEGVSIGATQKSGSECSVNKVVEKEVRLTCGGRRVGITLTLSQMRLRTRTVAWRVRDCRIAGWNRPEQMELEIEP